MDGSWSYFECGGSGTDHQREQGEYVSGERRREGASKTEASLKDVPLDAQTEEPLCAWRQRSPHAFPSDWVFASPHTKGRQPYWPGMLRRYYGTPALKRVGVTKHVSYHTFRHTFGTLLNANGENPKVVQELLRHASLKVTTDVYMQAISP